MKTESSYSLPPSARDRKFPSFYYKESNSFFVQCADTYFVLWNLQYSWQPRCTARCPCDHGNPPSSCRLPPASPHSAPGSLSASVAAGRGRRDEEASSESVATMTPPSSASHLRQRRHTSWTQQFISLYIQNISSYCNHILNLLLICQDINGDQLKHFTKQPEWCLNTLHEYRVG